MAAKPTPVEVGTRGTIGSLVSQEIEYFRRLDLGQKEVSSQKQKKLTMDVASPSGSIRNKSGSGGTAPKKKKKMKKVVSIGGFLPSICSAVEIANPGQTERIKEIGYKNLRKDGKKLQQD
ncbi:hypothetical protein COCNU_contig69256200G000010 [Cocos nucifera]|nr:hypothetical protein [Cocos nucifera]